MKTAPHHNARRAIVGATIGNAIEFYDFLVYSIFAIQIGQAFFPSDNAYLSLIASLATFGAGFVSRPLGAWLIGSYADRHGRRPALLLTLGCMGAGIAGLALTPSYAQIGIAAPIIAVTARLLQGFALGGEVGPSTAFLIEASAHTHRGLIGSLQRVTQLGAGGLGALAGLVLSLVLTKAELAAYGWRIALGLGLVVIPYALWVRQTLPETHAVEERVASAPPPTRREWRIMALGFVLFSAGTSTSYILNYLGTFAQASLHMGQSEALGGQFLSYVTGVIAGLGAGWLSDKVGRRPVILAAAVVPLLGGLAAVRLADRQPLTRDLHRGLRTVRPGQRDLQRIRGGGQRKPVQGQPGAQFRAWLYPAADPVRQHRTADRHLVDQGGRHPDGDRLVSDRGVGAGAGGGAADAGNRTGAGGTTVAFPAPTFPLLASCARRPISAP